MNCRYFELTQNIFLRENGMTVPVRHSSIDQIDLFEN